MIGGRIDHPNSRPRSVNIIGVGDGGKRVVLEIDKSRMREVEVRIPDETDQAATAAMLDALPESDMVFVVACDGDDLGLAPRIKQALRSTGVMVTGVLIQETGREQLAKSNLALLRASSDILVIAADASYVADMLLELGA